MNELDSWNNEHSYHWFCFIFLAYVSWYVELQAWVHSFQQKTVQGGYHDKTVQWDTKLSCDFDSDAVDSTSFDSGIVIFFCSWSNKSI